MRLSELLNLQFLATTNFQIKRKKLSTLQKLESDHLLEKFDSFIAAHNISQRCDHDSGALLTDAEQYELIELLKNRWDVIQSSNSCYTQNSIIPANTLCTLLAKELGAVLQRKWVELLMPTVRGIANPFLRENLDNDSLVSLSPFVLTDDNTLLIDVNGAMKQFETEERFTKIVDGNTELLSEAEIERVIYHSNASFKYYTMLKQFHEMKRNEGTLGYELHQLKLSLEHISIDGKGTELMADTAADLHILQFHQMIDQLTNDQRETLFSASFIDSGYRKETFRYIWEAISDERIRSTNAVRCAKTLAEQIGSLLQANPALFLVQVKGMKHDATKDQMILEKRRAITSLFDEEIVSDVAVTSQHGKEEQELGFILPTLTDPIGIRLFCTNKQHLNFLARLSPATQQQVFNRLWESEEGRKFLEHAKQSKNQKLKNVLVNLNPVPVIVIEDEEASDNDAMHVQPSGHLTDPEAELKTNSNNSKEVGVDSVFLHKQADNEMDIDIDLNADDTMDIDLDSHQPETEAANSVSSDSELSDIAFLPEFEIGSDEPAPEQSRKIKRSRETMETPDHPPVTELAASDSSTSTPLERGRPFKKGKKGSEEAPDGLASRHNITGAAVGRHSFFSLTDILASMQPDPTLPNPEDIEQPTIQTTKPKSMFSQKKTNFNVSEYAEALSQFNSAIEKRRIRTAEGSYNDAFQFLLAHRHQLKVSWYNLQYNILVNKKKVILDQAKEYHAVMEQSYLLTHRDLFTKIQSTYKDHKIFQLAYYLSRQLQEIY